MFRNSDSISEAVTGMLGTSLPIVWLGLRKLGFKLPDLPPAMSHDHFGDYGELRIQQIAVAVVGHPDASEEEIIAKIKAAKAAPQR